MLAACEYKERVQAASAIITRDGITGARAGAFAFGLSSLLSRVSPAVAFNRGVY